MKLSMYIFLNISIPYTVKCELNAVRTVSDHFKCQCSENAHYVIELN